MAVYHHTPFTRISFHIPPALKSKELEGLTLLNPLACLYHSLILFKVDLRVRSNMNRMATASLETSGSMETNSLWPPRSHIWRVGGVDAEEGWTRISRGGEGMRVCMVEQG